MGFLGGVLQVIGTGVNGHQGCSFSVVITGAAVIQSVSVTYLMFLVLMLIVALKLCHFVCFNWPCSNLLACTM